ncbi:MAG TPA: DUF4157 domain-containing protein [Pseudonocardiaceae bacterium]|nr:DUF4157 domain-containing protein [Pseudonocardiaceae bacterium]
MRWQWLSFWRRNTSGQPVPRQRAWSRLPPLRITLSPHPPVLVPLLHRPVIATTRDPLARSAPARRIAFEAPGRGSVTGLVRASYATQPELPSDMDDYPIQSEPLPVPVVVRPLPRDDSPAEPLTSAVDTYVGEPTAPDVPYRTSSFNRLLAQFDGEPDGLAQAAMLALGGMSSQATAPPPRGAAPEQASAEPMPFIPSQPVQQQVLRRPSLAQSRRLGLAGRADKQPEPDRPDELADEEPPRPSREAPPTRRLGIGAPLTREQTDEHPAPNPREQTVEHPAPNPRQQTIEHPAPNPREQTVEHPAPNPRERTAEQPAPNPRDHQQAHQPPPTQSTEQEPPPPPIVYRAAPLDPLPPPPVKDEPMRQEPVPIELATEFRTRFDIDVTEVPIHRGPAVTTLADAASARAFTQHGEVYLPDEAGELTEPDGRALLAHELVHVAQQRVLGPDLPGESSPGGALLEAAAAGTERWMRGRSAPPPTLIPAVLRRRLGSDHPDDEPPPAGPPAAFVHQPQLLPIPPPAPITETHVQRAAVEQPAQHFDLDTLLSSAHADGQQVPTSITAVATESGPVYLTAPRPAASPPDPSGAAPDIDALRGRIEQLASTVDQLATARPATPEPPGEADRRDVDRSDVDELARRLYPRIRDNLRHELIIDRERAGRLSDLR